ncbi:MAG: hemerythrin domain-containing protein [Arcticibacter sp.]
MKRNKNLVELSKDHHHGLLLGWKIKQGLKSGVPLSELTSYVKYFASAALFPHFDEEENQLLPFLDAQDSYRIRTIQEHLQLKQMIGELSGSEPTDEALLLAFTGALDAHIRFEERELFPYMEKLLDDEQLEEAGKLLAEQHQPYVESYPNEFWSR